MIPVADATPPGLRGAALWGVLAGVFAVGSQSMLLSPVLKDVAATFQSSEREAAYAALAYGLSLAVSAPLTGLLSDLLSRRHALLFGLIGVMLTTFLAAASTSLAMLVVAQGLCGLCAGAFLPSAYALVGDRVPFAERGRVMGRVMFGWSLAMVFGVPMGGLIGEHFGWRAALGAVALLSLAAAILLFVAIKATPIALPSLAEAGRRLRQALIAVIAARRIPALLFVNFLNMGGFFGIYIFLGSFVRDSFGLGPDRASLFVVFYGLGSGLMTLNARLFDRFGKARSLVWGLVGVACVLALIPWVPVFGWPSLAILMALWGGFQGACVTSLTTLVTQQSETSRGAVTALMSCTTYLGVAAGAALMGLVYEYLGYVAVGVACGAGTLLGAWVIRRLRLTG